MRLSKDVKSCFSHTTAPNILPGDYAGFDESQPTSSSGGKAKVAGMLKETSKKLVFIGDGATDLEASPIVVSTVKFLKIGTPEILQ